MARNRPPARTSIPVTPTPFHEAREPGSDQEIRQANDTIELLTESLVELERAMAEPDWVRLTSIAQQQFTNQGMQQIRAVCRVFSIINPLIKRGLSLRSAYVWGQGVGIVARANGRETDEQDVQAVVDDFLTDPGNLRALTGPEARGQLERALGTDGNIFVSLFTAPLTGRVSARVLPCDEIVDIICNPEDESEPWYYRRRWYKQEFDIGTGRVLPTEQECYYPAVDYRPTGASKPRWINSWPVRWDAPVKHVSVNRPLHWKFGVPDAYAAIDWARAYRDFLTDWAKLMKSLARFAFKATASGSKAAQVRAALAAAPAQNRYTGSADSAGGTAIVSPDVGLEAMSKSGATLDSDSGRPIATMVASALDVPVTMLLSDPGQTGNRATAETLDQPTENAMRERRELWTTFYTDILAYVITESVRAPKGSLKGNVRKDPLSGREYLTLAGGTTDTVDITWASLSDTSIDVISKAIQEANSTGVMPPEIVLRLLLTAFNVRGVDEIIEKMTDADGGFIWPKSAPVAAGTQMTNMAQNGEDPAQAGNGPMDGSDETNTDGAQPGDGQPVDNGG